MANTELLFKLRLREFARAVPRSDALDFPLLLEVLDYLDHFLVTHIDQVQAPQHRIKVGIDLDSRRKYFFYTRVRAANDDHEALGGFNRH